MSLDAAAAVEALYRSDWGRIVAVLIGQVRDFDLAEESVQEAFAAAVDRWRVAGVPQFPRAWIIQTARHKAIDRIRSRARSEEKLGILVTSGLVQIGTTQSAPGLPLIASKRVPAEGIEALVGALADAVAHDRPLAKRLKLDGFARRPLADYTGILDIETDAVERGYPRLA